VNHLVWDIGISLDLDPNRLPHGRARLHVLDDGGVAVAGVVDAEHTLSGFLAGAKARLSHGVVVVVGPEGGLDPAEQQAFADVGVTAVRWSRFVLRTETAGLAALAIVQAALDEA
jgi:16S rRNA (uracil1498-N3)-methyltransferase